MAKVPKKNHIKSSPFFSIHGQISVNMNLDVA